jgi:exodeoxyribonuclease V beta subunit
MAEKLNEKGVWNELDYNHNALIEASAGTGKTYALENIVKTLICDKGYEAKSILLVTFTEKAAGELKNRVREALVKVDKLPVDFDEMTICTIHSFCQRLLSEYAFENGVPMRCEVGGDSTALARRAVLETLKGGFLNRYGNDFSSMMGASKWSSISDLLKWIQSRVEQHDGFDIEFQLNQAIQNAINEVSSAQAKLSNLNLGNVGEYICTNARFWNQHPPEFYVWLKNNYQSLSNFNVKDVENVLQSYTPQKEVRAIIRAWNNASVMNGRSGSSRFDSIPHCKQPLDELLNSVNNLYAAYTKKQCMLIGLDLLKNAHPIFQKLKQDAALMTFDDLVVRAAEVVCKNSETKEEETAKANLCKSIRSRYRVALVDESQDTDQKQWDIFRMLFSAENNKVE